MSEWTWVKNPDVNDIPGRIPTVVLPDWEARGWVECPAPGTEEPAEEQEPTVKPSASGPKKENDRG